MTRPTFQFYHRGTAATPAARGGPLLPVLRWRLIAANGRDLGRSANLFPDVATGETSIKEMLAGIDALREKLSVSATSQWGWVLTLDGVAVAVSARSFARRVECALSLQQFRTLAPVAGIDPEVRAFGKIRRRSSSQFR